MTMLRKMMAVLAAGAMVLVQLPMMASADEAAEIRMAPPAAPNRPDFSYMGAVGTLTEAQTVMVANAIFDAIVAGSGYAAYDTENVEKIPSSAESKESIAKIYKTIRYTYREALVCNSNIDHDYKASSQYMTGLFIHNMFPDPIVDEEYVRICGLFDELEAEADPNWSAPEKVIYFHERLASSYTYEWDAEGLCYTAYGLLTNGQSVCEGYAWAYNVLMHDLGVESYVVTSKENDHSWNLVKIDGEYYHVDVTWDNTKAGEYLGRVWHESLLRCSPDMVSSGHTHNSHDWLTTLGTNGYDMAARSYRYNDAFWVNSYTRIFPFMDGWLVKPKGRTGQFQYYTFDRSTRDYSYVQNIAEDTSKWHNYSDNESTFFVENDVLYYATQNGMMAVAHRPGGNQWDYAWIWLFSLSPEEQQEGLIYGMTIENGQMVYMISRGPKKKQHVVHTTDMQPFYDMIAAQLGGAPQSTAPETTTAATTTVATTTTTTTTTTTATTITTTTTTKATTTTTTKATTATTTTTTKATTTTTATTAKETTTATTAATTTATEATTEFTAYDPGDLDGDADVSVVDVVMMVKALCKQKPVEQKQNEQKQVEQKQDEPEMTEEAIKAADVNGDGELDVFDLAMLQWRLVNK